MLSLWANPTMDVSQFAYVVASLFSLQGAAFNTTKMPKAAIAFSAFQFIGMSLTAGFGSAAMGFLTDMATDSDSIKVLVHALIYFVLSFAAIIFTVAGLPQALRTELVVPTQQKIGTAEQWVRWLSRLVVEFEEEEEEDGEEENPLRRRPVVIEPSESDQKSV